MQEQADECIFEKGKKNDAVGAHMFKTSCGQQLSQYSFMFEYKYCPYCGKEIKW